MERFGGFVSQFQGDGIVVYFGYPVAHENDAERAVRASLEFLHRLQNLDPTVRDGSNFPLTARVGIHTGLALIGPELLSGGVSEFSAIGEAVNLAARLQAEAPPGSVVVSRETAQLVESRFTFEDLGWRTIKGFSRDVLIYPELTISDEIVELLPVLTGKIEAYLKGVSADLYRIREYLPEDSARHVDWKATAKSGNLKVREYSREDERRLRFVFDNPAPDQISSESYERLISMAASAACRLEKQSVFLSFVSQD